MRTAGYPTLKETDITRQIRTVLKTLGIFHFKHFGGPLAPKGISDLIGCHEGKFIALEVKRPGGKPSPEQMQFIADVQRSGGIAGVVYSVEDVIELLGLKNRFLF